MHIFKSLHFLKEVNNLWFTNLVGCIFCFEYWFCAVASRRLICEFTILFKTSHLRLRLRRNYFFGLGKRLRGKIFRVVARGLAAQLL